VSSDKNRLQVLSASGEEKMYPLGNLRHQKKFSSPSSEFRQENIASPQCIRGRGDVAPGQVEAPEKVLLTLE